MKRHLMIGFALSVCVLAAPNYNAIYNEAYELLEAGKNSESRSKFQIVLEAPPESGLLDNAEYWIANSFLREFNYNEAVKHYKRAQILPDGNKHAASQFELAKALSMAGDTIGAVIEYYKVLSLYPDEGLNERALARIDSIGDFSKVETASIEPAPQPPKPRPATAQVGTPKPPPASQQSAAAPAQAPKPVQTTEQKPPIPTTAQTTTQPSQTAQTAQSTPQTVKIETVDSTTQKPVAGQASSPVAQAQPSSVPGQPAQTGTPIPTTTTAPAESGSVASIGGVSTYSPDSVREQYSQQYPEGQIPGVPWDQPSPVLRDDGILTLPLYADPRALILPKDKQGF